ncbi:MAG: hypothetical protein WD003_01630 [Candidatus Paceibacterota bacterium]
MRIVIATPLYPPDTADLALYTKDLAQRLSASHTITIILYGTLPEDISGVQFICVDKHKPTLLRIFLYIKALAKAVQKSDILYAQNGPSVELPVGIIARFFKIPLITHRGDLKAHQKTQKSFFLRLLKDFSESCSLEVITKTPPTKPEVLPFQPKPQEKLLDYERKWKEHVDTLEALFKKYGPTK